MPKESWKTSETDVELSRIGVMNQAVTHGLDVDDEKVKAFLEVTIQVQAAMSAESRWLRGIIDDMSIRSQNPAPKS